MGRVVLLKQEGVSVAKGSLSVTIETGVLLLLALVLGISLVGVTAFCLSFGIGVETLLLGCAAVVSVSLCVLVLWFKSLNEQPALSSFSCGRMRALAQDALTGVGCYLLNFAFLGVSLWLIGWAAYGQAALPILDAIGIMGFAWFAGTVIPGSPAGVGVREVIALSLLSAFYQDYTAGILLLHRLALTLGDLWTFLCGLCLARSNFAAPTTRLN